MTMMRTVLVAFFIVPTDDAVTLAMEGPCDIYGTGGVPCVAAHSTVRSLYGNFSGALYLVRRSSDGATKEIHAAAPGGLADGASQDAFCATSTCRIQRIFDQSPRGNHLDVGQPLPPRNNCSDVGNNSNCPGCERLPPPATCDIGVDATKAKLTVSNNHTYAAYFTGGMGYHFNGSNSSGMPLGDDPESIYMVTSGRFYNNQCCFDYGNSELELLPQGAGAMEAVQFSSLVWAGHGGKGNGTTGPWIMADLEHGTWPGNSSLNIRNNPVDADLVTAMLKGEPNHMAIKGGDAQAGGLRSMYDGPRPPGYSPMKKQGGIILGVGGDNSHRSVGVFVEGVIASGYASEALDDKVQANIAMAYAAAKLSLPLLSS